MTKFGVEMALFFSFRSLTHEIFLELADLIKFGIAWFFVFGGGWQL